jgi:hypothetical protein
MLPLVVSWAAGALVTVVMLLTNVSGERALALRPKGVYPLAIVCWPVLWLVGIGACLALVGLMLAGAAARHR